MCYCMVFMYGVYLYIHIEYILCIKSLMVSGKDTIDLRVVGYRDIIKIDLCRSSMATPSSPNGENIIQSLSSN